MSSHADVHARETLESERAPVCRMKVHLGLVVTAAGICGTLSFVCLATSLGTDYWYIIEVNPAINMSDLNSHSGLWSIYEGIMHMFFYLSIKRRPICFFHNGHLNCDVQEGRRRPAPSTLSQRTTPGTPRLSCTCWVRRRRPAPLCAGEGSSQQ